MSPVCSNPQCDLAGQDQPASAFYKGKVRCKVCTRASHNLTADRARERRQNSPYAVDRESAGRVDVAPLRAWLDVQLHLLSETGRAMEELCARLDVDERTVWAWMNERRSVQLDVIDAALCNWGDPSLLHFLWPHLYETCPECFRTGTHTETCPVRPRQAKAA